MHAIELVLVFVFSTSAIIQAKQHGATLKSVAPFSSPDDWRLVNTFWS